MTVLKKVCIFAGDAICGGDGGGGDGDGDGDGDELFSDSSMSSMFIISDSITTT
jgi:hypothetical protein